MTTLNNNNNEPLCNWIPKHNEAGKIRIQISEVAEFQSVDSSRSSVITAFSRRSGKLTTPENAGAYTANDYCIGLCWVAWADPDF